MSKRFQMNIAFILMILAVAFYHRLPDWLTGVMLALALIIFLTIVVPMPWLQRYSDARKARMQANMEIHRQKLREQGVSLNADKKPKKNIKQNKK